MSARRTTLFRQGCGRQRGAVLMVMLVIVVIGAAAILVSVLTSSALKIERDKTTADALAKAKEALIAYAVSDVNRPGELPCPDINDDGAVTVGTDTSGSNCASPIGRLPWKTLDLPELRDGNGEHLWYAVSNAFWANGSSNINSDTQGAFSISGNTTANNVIAIVFAAGSPLSGQDRSSTSSACTTTGTTIAANLCASNYLEGSNANLSTTGTPNTAFQTASASTTFNDQMIDISHNDLFPQLEWRIAREAKQCLDAYAADSSNTYHRYPWAVPDYSASQSGIYNTLFGRIAATPLTTKTSVDSTYALTMLNALSSLQIALTSYQANINATTTSTLLNAGLSLISAAQNAGNNSSSSFYSYGSITGNADTAGDKGRDLANGVSGITVATVQGYINSTYSSLDTNGFIDDSMPIYWPSSCLFTSSSYWSAWQKEVFYQVAAGNSPGTSVSVCNTSCLSVSGSGNPYSGSGTYRAVVIVGRAKNGTGTDTSNPPSKYLEGGNLHDSNQNFSTSPVISPNFVTYKLTDANYSSVNDLVLCLDGSNNCK